MESNDDFAARMRALRGELPILPPDPMADFLAERADEIARLRVTVDSTADLHVRIRQGVIRLANSWKSDATDDGVGAWERDLNLRHAAQIEELAARMVGLTSPLESEIVQLKAKVTQLEAEKRLLLARDC